ncbi:MAG TPA: hypothetical protein VF928_00545 [Usitatibacteraceae bacterium]
MDQNQDPRWLRLRPSRIHLAVTAGGALVAGIVAAFLPLAWWGRLMLIAAVILLATREVRRARLLDRGAVTAFYLRDAVTTPEAGGDGEPGLVIRLRYRANVLVLAEMDAEGAVLSGAYVTPWFSSLPYCLADDPPWRRRWPRIIPLWPDSLEADAFRRVRVQLKWT